MDRSQTHNIDVNQFVDDCVFSFILYINILLKINYTKNKNKLFKTGSDFIFYETQI